MSFLELSVESRALSVRHANVREAACDLFRIEVWCRADDPSIDLGQLVDHEATLTASQEEGTTRKWVGIVRRAELQKSVRRAAHDQQSTYFIEVVPKLWRATQKKNHRIFQKLNIPDIVEKILKAWGVDNDWKDVDRAQYPALEYKVQYDESDFAFVTRLLEEAGIAWLYCSDVAGEKLSLSDKLTTRPPRKYDEPLAFEDSALGVHQKHWVGDLHHEHWIRPGQHVLADFDFRNPSYKKRGDSQVAKGQEGQYEQFEYTPGSFLVVEDGAKDTPAADAMLRARYVDGHGKSRSQVSHEAARTGRRVVSFDTNVLALCPGMGVTVVNHPHELLEKPLVVTEFALTVEDRGVWKMRAAAVLAEEPYRPAQKTPKPSVYGVQSAVVVGPSAGDENVEIHTDEFGRVRVQFPWDREGQSNEHSSCWMRVAQGWAGLGFGLINLPRVGQEVLVGFLAGDPDQPMVMGRVFNALNPVPYKLPEHKTQSGWRTWSSPKSKAADQTPFNELKFEDNASKEFIYLQAQRDFHQLVKHNEVIHVKRHLVRLVDENQHSIVKKNKRELVEIDDHLHVKGDRYQKVEKSVSLAIGTDQDIKIGTKHALEAGEEIHLKAGSKIVLEAGSKFTIKGPGGYIDIHAGGIDIQGTMVKINSGGSPASGSGASPKDPKDPLEASPMDESAPDNQYDES